MQTNPLRARRVKLAATAQTKLEKIAKVLELDGVDAFDEDLIVERIKALFAEASAAGEDGLEIAARRTGLTAREIAMCRRKKISIGQYAARRAARGKLPRRSAS